MSMAPHWRPRFFWTVGLVPGTVWSGVVVARIRTSMSAGLTPALAIAACAASVASPDVVPPTRRSRMPVRSVIQSSLVSIVAARSSLVTTLSGTASAPTGDDGSTDSCRYSGHVRPSSARRSAGGW